MRERALQALFFMDLQRDESPRNLALFCKSFSPGSCDQPFFSQLVNGVLQRRKYIDGLIERFSNNWRMHRMSGVDRNILRLAVYEMLFCTDIPCKVSINEAIDIAKRYGTGESGAFINGILDAVNTALKERKISLPTDEGIDALETRCPRLGGPVPFRYCRSAAENEGPCWKILDCWWERFDVKTFLKARLEPAAFEVLQRKKPPSKIAGILELIEKAKGNQ